MQYHAPPSASIPRRWDAEVDGIRWLPRLIDKARMRRDGKLGAYLLGQSPVDKALLKRLRIGTEAFAAIAENAPDDAAVLVALRRKGIDEEAVRAWSDDFPVRYASYIPLWDLDEGYVKASLPIRVGLALFRRVELPLMALVRKVVKAP